MEINSAMRAFHRILAPLTPLSVVDDGERTFRAIKGGDGKRLTYETARSAQSTGASHL
jgi:hypothetical protein